MKTAKSKKTSDGLKILNSITGSDAGLRIAINDQKLRFRIAEMVFAAREAKNLSQAKLAQLMGTQQSVISRIEDAEDDGSVTIATLERLFRALDLSLSFHVTPARTAAVSK